MPHSTWVAAICLAVPLAAFPSTPQRTVAASPGPSATAGWQDCADAGPPEDTEAGEGRAHVTVRGDSMEVDARGCALTGLLALISRQTAVRISVSEALVTHRVTLRVTARPIEEALRELLRATDFFMLHAAGSKGAPRLAAVWVYPGGSAGGIAPVPAELWASTSEFEGDLAHGAPEARARAIEELIERAGEASLPRVFEAFADDSGDVRHRALDAALAASLDIPLSHLQFMTLTDGSPEVRLRALQALEERPDARWIVEAATLDTDADIRREARNILRRWKPPPR